jgi:hypothetical protein
MARKVALALAAGLALGLPAPAFPAFSDGNKMLKDCEGQESPFVSGVCLGQLWGIVDGYELLTVTEKKAFCRPSGVSGTQLKDVVVAYLRSHPDRRHLGAPQLMLLALNEAWPCPNGVRVAVVPGAQGIIVGPPGP